MAAKNNIPRYVIVQDQEVGAESVVRVVATSDNSNEQAGLTLDQPDVSNTLVGDIRPALSGVPERPSTGEIDITASGGAGTLRWGFIHTDADATKDLQLRQRPGVVGREPALIAESTSWFSCPRLVPLINGDLLSVWMDQSVLFFDQDLTTVGTWTTTFSFTTLDHTNDTWNAAASAAELGEWGTIKQLQERPSWKSFDLVQYPDTGELIAVVVGDARVGPLPSPVVPYGGVFSSVDNGATWNLRRRLSFQGSDGLLGFLSNIELTALGVSLSCAVEITVEGRLVMLWGMRTEKMVSMTSDDRGHNWSAVQHDAVNGLYQSNDAVPVAGFAHQRLSMRRMRNGVILAVQSVAGESLDTGDKASLFLWMTADGISWEATPSTHTAFDEGNSFSDVAICENPDGFPWFFGTVHQTWRTSSTFDLFDELRHIPFTFRDVGKGDTADDVWHSFDVFSWHLLVDEGNNGVARPNNPQGDLGSLVTLQPKMDGFTDLDSVRYRGQLVHAVVMNNESATKSSLMALRTNYFQPLQEREGVNVQESFATLFRHIAGFSRTWDCYQDPDRWGHTLNTTGGTGTLSSGGTENGYWGVTTAAQSRFWKDTSLPNALSTQNAVMRTVMRPVSGGSLAADHIAARLQLHDIDLATSLDVSVRISVSGADVEIQGYDNRAAALLGVKATLTGALGDYIEILVSTQRFDATAGTVTCSIYARAHDRATDPDWLVGYTLVFSGSITADAVVLDSTEFGHLVSATANSHWKCMHLWRQEPTTPATPGFGAIKSVPPLAQQPSTYEDTDRFNLVDDWASPNTRNDSGERNFMRTAQGISYPAQFFADGIHTEWRGESLSTGAVGYGTDFTYAAKHLLDQSSPQREYRSENTTGEIEIVLDATLKGGPGAVFTTRAIAVIGRNFPAMKIQLNDLDSWGAPSVDLRAAVPGLGVYDRATHLLDFSTCTAGKYRMKVTTAAATAKGGQVFRPHRFKAIESGRTFYAVFENQPSSGVTTVIKIIDNTEDTIILESDPIALGITATPRMSIISDRFAWDFSHAMPASPTGYRYIRLVLEGCTHEGADAFFKAGAIILGQPTEMEPGIVWGYSTSRAPGASLISSLTGAMFSSRQSAQRGAWSFDAPGMLSANESSADAKDDIEQARASWQKLVDLAGRLEQNGEMCALVFDGLRFDGSTTESGEQLLTDPYDLALVRLTSAGAASHQGYSLDTILSVGADTTDCVPRPVVAVRGITFTEQL